ncbi:uncharacterized protein LOC143013862 isoform X2 [Genypterus blacodes]|uniref:uncharacterized protein LOC143013862 isoform X2 n=1 Tax=Genypterus blacodes TaxID=154954 RepID=UPI003F760B33
MITTVCKNTQNNMKKKKRRKSRTRIKLQKHPYAFMDHSYGHNHINIIIIIVLLLRWCVAGRYLCAASPALLEVQEGANVSLTCNLTCSSQVTWYRLSSEQLLPLLTARTSRTSPGSLIVDSHDADEMYVRRLLPHGPVSLEILDVEQRHAGTYFCAQYCDSFPRFGPFLRLIVGGCILLCFTCGLGLYLCSGKSAVCCCRSSGGSKEEDLHYSSLKHADRPRPPAQRRAGPVEEDVTYSSVSKHTHTGGSGDQRGNRRVLLM